MPPQQRQRLADGIGELLGFGTHWRPPAIFRGAEQWRAYIGRLLGPVNGAQLSRQIWASVDAAALIETTRLVGSIVRIDEVAALVGEADDRVGVVGLLGRLECLEHRILLCSLRPEPRSQAHANELHSWRYSEGYRSLVGERRLHEVREDGGGDVAASLALAHGTRRVVADEHAHHQVGSVANKPGISFVAGGSGLARHRHIGK